MSKKILIIILGIFLISLVPVISPVGVSFCCEKTNTGALCQNDDEANCNDAYRKAPTSCEATRYCSLGCCYDSQEGTCMENTPERVCNDNGGIWNSDAQCDIPQCELGCCLIGSQAAFVTQTRCKRLSSLYGLEINFRTDIENEIMCIASASSDEIGACVFEEDYANTCSFISQKQCADLKSTNDNVEFHKGYLCSAESLGTNCGPTKQTKCVEGRDEVYFVDSCGNLANIYDATKINDKNYWSEIYGKSESCSLSDKGAKKCGNCDYYGGSTCKFYKRGEDQNPDYGDYVCRDLSCEYEGENYEHGETWCAESGGVKDSFPGSRHFRLVCYNNEVTVEACADYRQEICIQDEINGFKTAGCRVNMWQDCVVQGTQKDCENTDKRDCQWVDTRFKYHDGSLGYGCVPLFAPGFNFWEEGDAPSTCAIASTQCNVVYKKALRDQITGGAKWECVERCECCINDDEHTGCTGDKWQEKREAVCASLGDCGISTNYLDYDGYHTESTVVIKWD